MNRGLKLFGITVDAKGLDILRNFGVMGSLIDFFKEYLSTTPAKVPPVKIIIAVNRMRETCRYEVVTGETEVDVLADLWEGNVRSDDQRRALKAFDTQLPLVAKNPKPAPQPIPGIPKAIPGGRPLGKESPTLNHGSKETTLTVELPESIYEKVDLSTPSPSGATTCFKVVKQIKQDIPLTFDDNETIMKRVKSEQDAKVVAQTNCPTPDQVMAELGMKASVRTGSAVRREKMPVLRQEGGFGDSTGTVVATHTPLASKDLINHSYTDARVSSFMERVKSAASVLQIAPEMLTSELSRVGITESDLGLKILDADITTEESLTALLKEKAPNASVYQLKPAVAFLKGLDPFKKSVPTPVASKPQMLNYAQMKDKDLLEHVVTVGIQGLVPDHAAIMELHIRAKYQPFVVLKGDGLINVEVSIEYLKRARKAPMPDSILLPVDRRLIQVYRIIDLYSPDHVVEICPICGGGLYKGYCVVCEVDFSDFDDEKRIHVAMLEEGKFNKDSLIRALRGHKDLSMWLVDPYRWADLKKKGKLPVLRIVQPRPASIPVK